jgi:hypothetical protein
MVDTGPPGGTQTITLRRYIEKRNPVKNTGCWLRLVRNLGPDGPWRLILEGPYEPPRSW